MNTTPVGMYPAVDDSPWRDADDFGDDHIVYDIVYNPEETRLLGDAARRGAVTIGGLDMLVEQAAAAYVQWTGHKMPVDVVRNALRGIAALTESGMLKLDAIEMREIRLPLKEPFVTASGIQDTRRILLLEISARTGETAWSECVAQETPHYSPETIDTAWFAIREWFVPALKGHDIRAPSDILIPLRAFRGHRMAKAALEMACWNLEAQRMNTSLAELLGGTQRRVPAGIALGMQPEESLLVERVQDSLGQGYRNVKIKIAPGADVRCVEAIRSEIGADVPLSVDANASYTLSDIELLRTLDAYGLTMIEQPLAKDDLVRHAALQAQLSTPVCLGRIHYRSGSGGRHGSASQRACRQCEAWARGRIVRGDLDSQCVPRASSRRLGWRHARNGHRACI